MDWFQVKSFLKYKIKSRYWKGFGIHSPFVFDLVANLFREKHQYYDFRKIDAWRRALERSNGYIEVVDYGAGSLVNRSGSRKISDIVGKGSLPKKYGELIFRIVSKFKPNGILELGTSVGISTLYMGLARKSAQLITIEGCKNIAKVAKSTFDEFDLKNVLLVNGTFDEHLSDSIEKFQSLDFVFIDGNHQKDATIKYYNQLCEKANNDTIIVLDDIHWSPGMEKAWEYIINDPRVTVSIDLFRIGIVFFRRENTKAHYIVRF